LGYLVKIIPHIFYLYVPCQPLDFLYPLMSLDGNLFQLLPVLVSRRSILTWSLRLSGPPLVSKNPLSLLSPTPYRPSATGFRASVRYLHHAVQSRSGIVLLLSVTGQHLGFLCFVWHTWISNLRFHRGLSATYCPQLPCLSDPESMPDANYVYTMRSISPLTIFLYMTSDSTVYAQVYTGPNETTTYNTGM